VFDLGLWILGACFGNLLHLGERLAEGSIWDQTRHIHDLNLFDSVGLTASETQRYSRHLVLPQVGQAGRQGKGQRPVVRSVEKPSGRLDKT
jgi:hypothetical protein